MLVVMFHAIGYREDSGLRVADDSIYRYLANSLGHVRMPLFTVITGFVYALRPVRAGSGRRFLLGKGRRIFLPLLSVSLVQAILKIATSNPGDLNQWRLLWRIWVFPFDHFWFLQAILQVFLVAGILDVLRMMDRWQTWLSCLIAAIAFSCIAPGWTVFAFSGFTSLLPYFVLGYGLNRYASTLRFRALLVFVMLAVVAAIGIQQSRLISDLPQEPAWLLGRRGLVGFAVGLGVPMLLFTARPAWRPLSWLGGFAYTIYLFHAMAVTATRIGMARFLTDNREVLFVVSVAIGIIAPILVESVLRRWIVTRRLFLGQR